MNTQFLLLFSQNIIFSPEIPPHNQNQIQYFSYTDSNNFNSTLMKFEVVCAAISTSHS